MKSLFFLILLNLPFCVFNLLQAQSTSDLGSVGVLNVYEGLLKKNRENFQAKINYLRKESQISENLSTNKKIQIYPEQILSILQFTPYRFLSFIENNNDPCHLVRLIQADLLFDSTGPLSMIVLSATDEKESLSSILTKKDQFIDYYQKKGCPGIIDEWKAIQPENLVTTLKQVPFTTPTTEDQCLSIHNNLLKYPLMPYLCRIELSRSRNDQQINPNSPLLNWTAYSNAFNYYQISFLKNFCSHIDNPKSFCDPYLAQDYWKKVLTGEKSSEKMSMLCTNQFEKLPLSEKELTECRTTLLSNKDFCQYKGSKIFSALTPKENCLSFSKSFNVSHLKIASKDCPGNIDYEGFTNIHRISQHFKPRKIKSSQSTCMAETLYTLFLLEEIPEVLGEETEVNWPLSLCYTNLVTNEEQCLPYILGGAINNKYSEAQVLAKIISRTNSTSSSNINCQFVEQSTYNPLRLDYRSGCFIVFDKRECNPSSCPKKIFYDNRQLTNIQYKGEIRKRYLPSSFSQEKNSLFSTLNEKLGLLVKPIENFTELHFFFEQKKNGIIQGVGCAEDLLPHFFKSKEFNACRPLPFIVDGIIKENENIFLSTYTAIDDIHSPRLINWNHLYSAVKNFYNLQAFKRWPMYGTFSK